MKSSCHSRVSSCIRGDDDEFAKYFYRIAMILKEGQNIRDTYKIDRFLGEGAFAEVYRVIHRFLGRQAMKVFKTPGLSLEEIEELLEEAVLLSRIGHPNIIRVFDANTFRTRGENFGFFTMEYVAGGSLDQYWQSHGNLFIEIDTTIDIFKQTCRALALAHSETPPIIHRDVKPHNILVGYGKDGLRIRLSDFGLAKNVNPLTLLASAKGTLAFKSPEAIDNFQSDSTAGDIWALGVTAYLMLTDRMPYSRLKDRKSFSVNRFKKSLIPPSDFNYLVDQEVDEIISKCLEVDPNERYPSANELMRDLESLKPTPEKPAKKENKKKSLSVDSSKSALGKHDPASERSAKKKVEKAKIIAMQSSRIMDAADLLEEAINEWPPLREKYEYQLSLWKRGLTL